MTQRPDKRLDFPATRRNQDAIHDVLAEPLTEVRTVLEIASGSGQHVTHLAARFPHITWQPSDLDPAHRESIAAWTADLDNVLAPLHVDAMAAEWDTGPVDAVFCINMIHIAPWPACLGLLAGCGRILKDGGLLYLYGPFKEDGQHNAESNAAFDESLRTRDPSWGVRDLNHVTAAAAEHGLRYESKARMPANNVSVFFRRHLSAR